MSKLFISNNNKKTPLTIYFLSFICFILLSTCNSYNLKVGGTPPDFVCKDILGNTHKLSKYKGKVVLVHFWTDFCKSCKVEFPKIQQLYEELKGKEFELLAINLGQKESISKDFQREFGVTFPMLLDTKNEMQKMYDLTSFPTNFFIDPKGKIIRIIKGWVDKRQVEVIIRQSKGGKIKNVATLH